MSDAAITAWLAGQQDAMVALLRELVNIDSGTYDKAGADAVGAAIQRFVLGHGVATGIIPQERFGDTLRAEVLGGDPARGNILLMGHRDTVFPKGTVAERPFAIRDGIAYGPGVSDMKSGLVLNSFLLAAFARFGGAPGPVVALYTADEEIGSPEGRPVIEAEARHARIVLNSEPARASGKRALFEEASVACPQCGSAETEVVSQFGSTACKSQHRCRACREPFEAFKCI